ncbi:hypothetical protein EHQ12_05545 [Leptospira gomenensis]|uniref:Rho-binding antiterminator n=1 Tax=Leptospira gomenensis TaxID=2484974 RepID=A0A5F1YB63_9LEPT|nr:hypothetical protein [Leptospira gomenensis]TGK34505.1 hypothetical protein EHQ17_08750 [Leptospira gomenensis]TGK40185.1 hypothetical protein EHQ07_19150 [Leptospira gomenensis]TGK41890.1 hypothetical protein EHQ12_05545 [Leptospira gomenensis]TGK55694.1 hypothetical protein EHQ13_17375 [Leptospira gomenensis]
MKEYVPVSCDLYDRLEEAVLRRTSVTLELTDFPGSRIPRLEKTRIVDLVSEDREEFAVLYNGDRIRLDLISKLQFK